MNGETASTADTAYVLLVSAIPALYRAWNQSPNAVAERLNGILYARVTEWVTEYQRATGRPVDSYPLARLSGWES